MSPAWPPASVERDSILASTFMQISLHPEHLEANRLNNRMTSCLRLHKSHGKQTPRVAFEDAAKPFASKDLGVMFHSRKRELQSQVAEKEKIFLCKKSRSQEMPDTCQATKRPQLLLQ